MYTKELLPILREFEGKKSIIKLMNGQLVRGTVGQMNYLQSEVLSEKTSVSIFDESENRTAICVSNINALRLA